MTDTKQEAPPHARLVEVIEVQARRGSGADLGENIARRVTFYYSKDGALLAEHDGCAAEIEAERLRVRDARIAELEAAARSAEDPEWVAALKKTLADEIAKRQEETRLRFVAAQEFTRRIESYEATVADWKRRHHAKSNDSDALRDELARERNSLALARAEIARLEGRITRLTRKKVKAAR